MAFNYSPMFQIAEDQTQYRLLTKQYVSTVECAGRKMLRIEREGLKLLAKQAAIDVSFYLRPAHLQQLLDEVNDSEASDNDKFVCYTHLQNAVVAAAGELPTCQDTGTAVVMAHRGNNVLSDFDEHEAISEGIYECYQERNLRYSQIAPLTMFKERNTGNNLPAQIDILSEHGDEYGLLLLTKGGGSANKTFLFQETPAILNERDLVRFLGEKLVHFGTAACPPYHVAIVIGGTSAEMNLKTVKLASAKYLDELPTSGSEDGRAFRDIGMEEKILQASYRCGVGAQFGGKYIAHDVRVIRLPRHAASCPIGMGVSCSADRNIRAKITKDGIFLEQLEFHPEKYLPREAPKMAPPVQIDLSIGMEKVRQILTKFPITTRLEITGTLIVARDAAHARIKQMLDEGKPMPEYFKQYPVYYAGPAKTPAGMASGSFGPTTAGRMDSFVDLFQGHGGSLIMIAKGNRSTQVTEACRKHGGFYLGSIGGPAAILAQNNIKKVELVDFEELGMEAIRKIEVENFPAFVIVDDKGNDFFAQLESKGGAHTAAGKGV